MTHHRPALFAAVLGLGRAASNIGDHWIQNDHCARVKAATDAKPVLMPAAGPDTEPVAHGSRDGIKACAWHCLTYTATQAVVVGAGAPGSWVSDCTPVPPRPRSPCRAHPLHRRPPRPRRRRSSGIASDA
ncbi:hypothetical protein AB0D46_30975 [Streptomyces sp. NPDC048383]|uniref:hypothetical protein n=1 Tax=Streptomyces sp. NPDC048383 TaxID=3155386 RepID=UPI003435CD6F